MGVHVGEEGVGEAGELKPLGNGSGAIGEGSFHRYPSLSKLAKKYRKSYPQLETDRIRSDNGNLRGRGGIVECFSAWLGE